MRKTAVRRLAESAVLIAVATVLSIFKFDLPFGGGVTIVSMLPIILLSHRYGWKWGLFSAFAYSLIQLILGLDNLAYASNFLTGAGIVLLDYVIAYSVLGLSGLMDVAFEGKRTARTSQPVMLGILITLILRFVCHWIVGAAIWGEWMPETFMGMPMTNPWVYSFLYNGWYMLFEIVITEIVVFFAYPAIGKFFRADDLKK